MSIRERFSVAVLSVFATFAFTGVAQADDPAFRAAPSSYDFGDIVIGEAYSGSADFIDFYPTSEATVEITGLEITGPDAADFSVEDGGCIDWPLEEYGCYAVLGFTSDDEPGLKEATLEVSSNATAGTKSVPLSANVVEPATNGPALAEASTVESLPGSEDSYVLYGMDTADFNGDGRADVVTNNQVQSLPQYGAAAGVAFGQSDGTLGDPVLYPAGLGVAGNVVTGDFDNVDGPDFVSASGGAANVFLNDGDGGFTAGEALETQGMPGFISPGDFNEDGDLDFTISDGNLMEIFLGDGEGGFTKTAEDQVIDGDSVMGATASVADFRGDGSSDVAITNYDGEVRVFLSDGDGTFTPAPVLRLGGCGCKNPWGLSVSDINGDGRDDLSVAIFMESQTATLIARPDGSMEMTQLNSVPLFDGEWDAAPKMVGNGDLNGDGIPEMISADSQTDAVTINTGLRSGIGFRFAERLALPSQDGCVFPSQISVADFNGDGRPDLAVGGECGYVMVMLNEGEPAPLATPESFDFGDQVTGTTSDSETIELSNRDGLAPLEIADVTLAGGDSSEFSILSGDCQDTTLLVGESCSTEVNFHPIGLGARGITLTFDDNSAAGFTGVQLSGDAVPPTPGIDVRPGNLTFADTEVGSESAAQSVTVTSNGSAPLVLGAVETTGSNSGEFAADTTACAGRTLAPGASCAVSVKFKPTGAGALSAALNIASDVSGGASSVSLSGTATAKPIPPNPPAPKVSFKKKPKKKYVIRTKRLKKVKIAFKSNQAGSRFQCRLDGRKFTSCKSPKIYKSLKPGRHVIKVRAVKDGKTGAAKAVKFKVVRKK
ncbi:MAG TPA: choice-of-anchor D domain-containing protein [Solirubrobacterales bacterium]|nr:choice-of-anchor D domain-containing protein [Solirubrobacterales bacterium]